MGRNLGSRNKSKYSKPVVPNSNKEVYLSALNVDNMTPNAVKYDFKFETNGDLKGFSLTDILRDTQKFENLLKLYQLSQYYCNADPIIYSAIHNVLIPFSVTKWRLQGGTETTRKFYMRYFEEVSINDLLYGIYHDIYIYGVCYIYVDFETGNPQILPPHRIVVSDLSVNGEPVIAYVIPEMSATNSGQYYVNVDKLIKKYKNNGYPKEIADAIKKGQKQAILNQENTFAITLPKANWQKYALPLISSVLPLMSKKNLISATEDIELNNMRKAVFHVSLGDKDIRPRPNRDEMQAVASAFISALTNATTNLAVTSWDVKAEWKYLNNKDMAESISKKYADVNSQILAGIGLSALIVAGDTLNSSTGSSFASVQVNANVASKRITQLINNVSEFLKKVMAKLAVNQRTSSTKIPSIVFEKVDLSTSTQAVEEITKLYQMGVIGKQTTLESLNFNYEQEKERRQTENSDGSMEIFTPPPNANTMSSNVDNSTSDSKVGRPNQDQSDMKSDKNKSETSKQPKPSDNQQ